MIRSKIETNKKLKVGSSHIGKKYQYNKELF